MIHTLVVFIVCVLFYWTIVSFQYVFTNPYPIRWKENLEDQKPSKPVYYTFEILKDGQIRTSNGENWKFSIPKDYVLVNDELIQTDECYGKEDGFLLEAKGQKLYTLLQQQQQQPSHLMESTVPTHVDRAIQNGRIFYFKCHNNQIEGVYACHPGNVFERNRCVAVNPCTSNNSKFPDAYNKQFYYECQDGIPDQKKCPENQIFFIDQCIEKSTNALALCEGEKNGTILPINTQTYVKCYKNRATYHTCPDGMNFFPSTQRCESNECFGYPDGLKPSPVVKRGPLSYHNGYIQCQGGRVIKSVKCPEFWDYLLSKGDNLTHLPSVFDKNTNQCTIPSLCENVQPDNDNIIVPVHEFSKYVNNNYPNYKLYDSVVGIGCRPHRHRVVLEPGMHISPEYRIESACSEHCRRVVIGDVVDRYYDCDSQSIISCPENTFFNGEECQERLSHAHSYKNIPIFKMDQLSPLNDWMLPTASTTGSSEKLEDPDYEYLWQYGVWCHKDCKRFPFLSHVKYALFLPDGKSYCKNKKGKIVKVRYRNHFRLKYWSQRFVPTSDVVDECYPGMKIRSGNFIMDSVFYATCDPNQPFVFCPSSSTQGIEKTNIGGGIWACKPYDRVYEAVLPAETQQTLVGLERFVPQLGARYILNGTEFKYDDDSTGIDVVQKISVTLWSDQPVKLYFKSLPTYPPDIYLDRQQKWLNVERYLKVFHDVILQEESKK